MVKARYTHDQIGTAFEGYYKQVDRVTEVLRLAPLNKLGIYTVANVSQDFMIITTITQWSDGYVLGGTIEDKIAVCRELILSKNRKIKQDESLLHTFAGVPLEVEESPFFFAAYDDPTFDYVLAQARTHQKLERGRVMYSEKGIPFLLAKAVDINQTFPWRARFKNIATLVKDRT